MSFVPDFRPPERLAFEIECQYAIAREESVNGFTIRNWGAGRVAVLGNKSAIARHDIVSMQTGRNILVPPDFACIAINTHQMDSQLVSIAGCLRVQPVAAVTGQVDAFAHSNRT